MEAAAIGEPGSRGVQKRAVTAQGFRSRVLEAAPEARSKEAVVFIHGAPGSAGDWYPLLSEVGAFARALAFDLPGFGSADKPARWDYSPDSFATFVAAALAELRVDRAHLVMSDLGGLAGLHWAAAHQHAFASAVLINTGVLIGYRWHLLGRLHRMPLVGTAVAAGGRVGLRAALRVYGTRLRKETQTRWTRGFDWGSRRAVLRFYRAAPASEMSRLAPALARLDRPALVLWGERDRFVPTGQAARLAPSKRSGSSSSRPASPSVASANIPRAVEAILRDSVRMAVRRIMPYHESPDFEATRTFYTRVLGLEEGNFGGGYIGFGSGQAQVLFAPPGVEPVLPDMGVDVDSRGAVDAAHAEAVQAGHEVIYGPVDEPWGVRRFFVRDPHGVVISVLAHE